jgi:uncharacterized sulfatase
MVRWPGKVSPRRDERSLASSIDLAPTILAACGLKPTSQMQGLNLLEAASGTPLARDAVFGATFTHDAVDIDQPAANLEYRWCVAGNTKLILPRNADEKPELYDVAADAHENRNLAAERPQRVEQLTRRIDAWWPARATQPLKP